jgi:hypothetical protein
MVFQNRLFRVLMLLVLELFLLVYGYITFPFITLNDCLEAPKQYDGRTVQVGAGSTVYALSDTGFVIEYLNRLIPVRGNTPPLTPGEFITVRGVFHQEGWVELKKYRILHNRHEKIWFSLIPVIGVGGLLVLHYRWNGSRRQIERR